MPPESIDVTQYGTSPVSPARRAAGTKPRRKGGTTIAIISVRIARGAAA